MKILTAGNLKFKRMIEDSVKKIEQFGYEPVVYDLGDLGFGKKINVSPTDLIRTEKPIACVFKPYMFKKCLTKCKEGEVIVYLDGDAFLLQKIDEFEIDDYDIAVTVRKEAKQYITHPYMGAVNAGVIVFRKNKATMKFIEKLIKVVIDEQNDQVGLNICLKEYIDLEKIGQVIKKNNLRVKLLPGDIYNNYYTDISKAKIRHLKGTIKKSTLNE